MDNFDKYKTPIQDCLGRELGKGDICYHVANFASSIHVTEVIIIDRTAKMLVTVRLDAYKQGKTYGSKGTGSRLILKEKAQENQNESNE